MNQHLRATNLEEEHSRMAIAARFAQSTSQSYLGDFILGAVDGAVTTFAIVSGVAGAHLSSTVAVILGLANLFADGLSMAVGNYMSAKSTREFVKNARDVEHNHIEEVPEGEREEIRQIYSAKGFEGKLLEQIVEVITDDRQRWIDTMVTEEFGLPLQSQSPIKVGLVTFSAFVLAGSVPLLPYCLPESVRPDHLFATSCVATAITFFTIGWFKGRAIQQSKWIGGLETLLLGGAAATVAFLVGRFLDNWLGG